MGQVIRIGDNSVQETEREVEYDPINGDQTVLIYEGEEGPINAFAAVARGLGKRAFVSRKVGPIYLCRVYDQEPTDGSDEVAADRYQLDTEWAEIPIWEHPKVFDNARGFGIPAEQKLGFWRQHIEDALARKLLPDDAEVITFDPAEYVLYLEMLRGFRAPLIKRPVLTRIRSISFQYSQPITVEPVQNIYSTARLVTEFNLPNDVARMIRNCNEDWIDVDAPDGRVWGWQQRKDTRVAVVGKTRIEEQMDWVFSTWATLIYNYVG